MPTNYRIYYPLHYVAIGPEASASGIPVHGVQSVNLTTSFNLEQVFELGQLDIYQNIEQLPNIEMTVEKALDGYPLIYHLGTRGATSRSLVNRTNRKADIFLSTFSDVQDNASGTPLTQAYCSGMYVNNLNYTLPIQGFCKESVTFVGNDKLWITGSGTVWIGGHIGYAFNGAFTGGDVPASGIQRRQNVNMGLGGQGGSIWPSIIPGVTVTSGSGYNVEATGVFGAHIQDVTITCSLGREDLFELGRRKPYYRYANFPVAVNCTINITTGGATPGDLVNADSTVDNLSNEPIIIRLADGTKFDLGTKNKLQSVSYSGGDTGGGVATLSYQFENFNKLDVTHPSDPEAL